MNIANNLPFGLSSDEALSICGPAWSQMTDAQRNSPPYNMPFVPFPARWATGTVVRFTELVLAHPKFLAREGPVALCRTFAGKSEADVIAMAEQLEHYESDEDRGIASPPERVSTVIPFPTRRPLWETELVRAGGTQR